LQAGTGQTILRNVAAGISYLHYAVQRATQQSLLTPGASKAAIYNGMNFLGVNPRRKLPYKVKAMLVVPDHFDTFVIPPFTKFTISSIDFFNRKAIVFTQFELTKEVELVQGTLFEKSGKATGIPYEKIEIGYD